MYNDVLQKYQEVLEQSISAEMIFFQNVALKQLPAGHEGTIQFDLLDNEDDHYVSAAPWGLSKEFPSLYPLSNVKEYFKLMMEGSFNGVVLKVMDPETETEFGGSIISEDLSPHMVHYTDGLVEDMFRLQDKLHKSYPEITANQVFVPELRPDEHKDAESPLYDLTWRVEKKALEKAGFQIQTAPINDIILFDRHTKPLTAWFCQDPVFSRKGVVHLTINTLIGAPPKDRPRPMERLKYEVTCWMDFAVAMTKPKMMGQILLPPKQLKDGLVTFDTTQGNISVVQNALNKKIYHTFGTGPAPNLQLSTSSTLTGLNVKNLLNMMDPNKLKSLHNMNKEGEEE